MKTIIRHFVASLVLLSFCMPSFGQSDAAPEADDLKAVLDVLRSDLNTYKIETLNQVMELTGPEAKVFWPVYQQYEQELTAVGDRKIALIRDFLSMRADDATTSKQWSTLGRNALKNRKDRLNLWTKYHKKLSKALSPYRAAQFLQVENQMALFVDINIASEMPVISTSPLADLASKPVEPPTREEAMLVSTTATVESINHRKREVTLKGPLGDSVSFIVDQKVKRLNEIKKGDEVNADYYISLAAELRAPTAAERDNPIQVLEAGARAPEGTSPAGGVLRMIKAVCTIEGLDRPTETVTVKGPLGRYLTVRAAHRENLSHLRIGETVVVTYTEALAVSLEKVAKKSS